MHVVEIPAGIDIVIVEGILTFYQKEIRDQFHMKIFVEADADTRLSRKGELIFHTLTDVSSPGC